VNDLDLDLVPFADPADPAEPVESGTGPGGPGRHRRKTDRTTGRTLVAFMVVVVVLGGLAFGGWYGVTKVRGFFTAPDYAGPGSGQVLVTVSTNQTLTDIGNTLYRSHVVKSAKAFVQAASDNPDAQGIQPSVYRMKKQMKASDAVKAMLDAQNRAQKKITIPEGLTTVEILAKLAKDSGKPLAKFQAAANDPAALGVPGWGGPNPQTPVLEGFLFPQTYRFPDNEAPADMLKDMVALAVQTMEEDDITGQAAALGLKPWDLLKVASLVEQEGIEADFTKIARVVYNRLKYKTGALAYLQFDSTTQYWLIKTGKGRKALVTRAMLQDPENNYSTALDRIVGLPPTPIGNPGKAALEAAANPADGNWTYFVVTLKDRHSSFTADYNQHLANVQKCKAIGRPSYRRRRPSAGLAACGRRPRPGGGLA